jgi:two-component system response regulator RegA
LATVRPPEKRDRGKSVTGAGSTSIPIDNENEFQYHFLLVPPRVPIPAKERIPPRRAFLLVNTDRALRAAVTRTVRAQGYDVVSASHAREAEAAAQQRFHSAVVDLEMRSPFATSLLQPLRGFAPGARVLLVTGYATDAAAIEAIRRGAHDDVGQPRDGDQVIMAPLRAVPVSARAMPRPAGLASLARAEWEHIQRVLSHCAGNISEAARQLCITRRTLQLKLKKYRSAA